MTAISSSSFAGKGFRRSASSRRPTSPSSPRTRASRRGSPSLASETAHALVAEGLAADLTVANNVLAHVPDLDDFVGGFAIILKSEGVATFEFPHLANLIGQTQFDTIYHEHFSYISLIAARTFFSRHSLRVFDVEKLPTHGGSLRLYVCRDSAGYATSACGRCAHRGGKEARP